MRALAPALRRFTATALRIALWPARVVAARAVLAELAQLDRRELADIGLSYADMRDATALARDRDPTAFLAERAGAKRAAARVCASPSRLPAFRPAKIHPAKIHPAKIRPAKTRPAKISPAKTGS